MRGGNQNGDHSPPSLSVKRRWDMLSTDDGRRPDNSRQEGRIEGVLDRDLLTRLLAQPQEQQTKMLRAMSETLDFGNALFIHALLEKRLLSMPLLAGLPRPILQHIFKRLDHKTLLAVACSCRDYERMVLRDGDASADIWSAVSTKGDPIPDEIANWMAHSASNVTHLTVEDYINGYKYAKCLMRNWTLHLGRTSVVEIAGSRTVTDMCADWSSQRLFMAADDSIVRVYEYKTGGLQLRGVLSGHQGGVWCMQVVGDILITGSTDRTIAVWNVRSMAKQLDLIGHASTIRSLKVHDQYVISGSRDGVIRVWEWSTGRCVHCLLGHSGSIRCLDIYKDVRHNRSFVISGSYDETAIIWDLQSGRQLYKLEGHSGRLYALAVYKHFVFTAGMDHRVKKWNILTGECVHDIYTSQTLIGMMAQHGHYLATGSTDGKVCVFDGDRGELLYTIQIEPNNDNSIATPPSITSISMNDNFIIVTSDTSAYIFNLSDGTEVHHLVDGPGMVWRGATTEGACFIAYQQDDSTRLMAADYRPLSEEK